MDEQAWREKSVEILTDVKEWRRAHSKATYVEIEDEVHRRMMELEAQILQDTAQASASREWGKTLGQPVCCVLPALSLCKHEASKSGRCKEMEDNE